MRLPFRHNCARPRFNFFSHSTARMILRVRQFAFFSNKDHRADRVLFLFLLCFPRSLALLSIWSSLWRRARNSTWTDSAVSQAGIAPVNANCKEEFRWKVERLFAHFAQRVSLFFIFIYLYITWPIIIKLKDRENYHGHFNGKYLVNRYIHARFCFTVIYRSEKICFTMLEINDNAKVSFYFAAELYQFRLYNLFDYWETHRI